MACAMQVQQKVTTDIEQIETELVSPSHLPLYITFLLVSSIIFNAVIPAEYIPSLGAAQSFNVALERPLSEEQAATLTW